ncbi:MAG: Lrp/AsnC family transcriptional regulator [Pseudomonadota bacterium]
MRKLDIPDLKLLDAVQKNARLTADQMSEVCGLSPTAALKRLKKLRSDGIIENEVAIVSPKAVGQTVLVIVLVTLERENKDVVDSFKRAIRATENIMQGYYITGDADFVLMISAQDMEAYEEFTREFFYDQHRIKTFKTLVVLDRVKSGHALPILSETPFSS